jgi:stage II sporulation protein D
VRAASAVTERAAEATAGQVLTFNGEPASIFYSASCGGRTERPSAVWPGAVDHPYLPTKVDDACGGQPEWMAEVRTSDLQRALVAAGFKGVLRSLRIASRYESGRVAQLALGGMTPGEISAQDLRLALMRLPGLPQVQSASFELRPSTDGYRFAGQGYGHGVGMCVIGSVRLAHGGMSARSILERYFPGTGIGSIGPALIRLAASEEHERAGLVALVDEARSELARSLAVTPPARIGVRVHASTAEFETHTGRPWFTLGAVVEGELHLVPLAMLRDRGMLELITRRQIVRVLTESDLGRRPLWVREGAALHYGDAVASGTRAQSRGACPSDDELVRPLSAGGLADAYARARSCFERQLAAGRSWREVR